MADAVEISSSLNISYAGFVNITQLHNRTFTTYPVVMSTVILHIVIGMLDTLLLPSAVIMSIIALIVYGRRVREPTVYFLRNLAVADLLIPIGLIFSISFKIHRDCASTFLHTTFLYIGAVSVNAVLAMVLEQLVRFLFPAREIFTKLRLGILFLVLWILPAFLLYAVPAIHLYVGYKTPQRGNDISFCDHVVLEFSENYHFVIRMWLAYCFICLFAVIGMYVYIYLIVRKVFSGGASRIHREDEDSEARTRMQMLKLTVWLLVCLLVFWGPLLIAWIIFTSTDKGDVFDTEINQPLLFQFIILFTLLNPIVDPIIVLLRMPEVKKRYRAICCCCCDKYKKKSRGNLHNETVTYTKTMHEQVELPDI